MEPCGGLGILGRELQQPLPVLAPAVFQKTLQHVELLMDSGEGVTRTEEVVGPDQGVPHVAKVLDRCFASSGGESVWSGGLGAHDLSGSVDGTEGSASLQGDTNCLPQKGSAIYRHDLLPSIDVHRNQNDFG